MYCQVVYICGCIPARIQHALADLPETLDETYERSLREINKADWEFVHRLFQFVAVASRPLYVEELADLLAFDFQSGRSPKFHEGWRPEDPVDAVLSTCSSLLAIVDGEYEFYSGRFKVIQFSHYSVKEYLESTRLAAAADINLRSYHVSMTPAHSLAAQACLGILLHLDKDVVTSDRLEKWPLAEYAAHHWVNHARFDGVSQNLEDGIKQIFDPRNPHLAVCVWIQNRRMLWDGIDRSSSHLHYAALWGLHSMINFLVIEHSQDVHSQDFTDNVTPLHLASEHGHVKTARVLIEHGAAFMAHSKHRATPLHLAAQKGQLGVTRILVECGADVTARDEDMNTPLHLASQGGHIEVFRVLIDKCANVSVQNKAKETPLHLAEHVEIARMLIGRGANVEARSKERKTPLHQVSLLGQAEVARMLIECGANVAGQSKGRNTPLHLASLWGQVEVARMLLERGADIAAEDLDGQSPLHLASQTGKAEVARVLIECGADMTARNKKGETPLHQAQQRRVIGLSLAGGEKVTRMLIEHGADVTVQNNAGTTPLHLTREVEVARMLVEHGADVMAQDKDGETPLHLASKTGQVEIARMLIECGADVTAKNENGEAPLHLASEAEIARMLIERGADVAAQNKDRETPLQRASSWEN